MNGVSNKRYRGINRLALSTAEFSDPRWFTYLQAQELGGHVRAGEKGIPIVFWRFPDEDEQLLGKPKIISRMFSVFNVDQCGGLGLPPIPQHKLNVDALDAFERVVEGYENRPRIAYGGDRAFYSCRHDLVQLPKLEAFRSSEAFANTGFHELLHSSGHPCRLNRPEMTEPVEFGSASYGFEELTAEIGAAFLCSEHRITNQTTQSASYVKGWLRALKNDCTMIVKAAARAEKGADWILGRRDMSATS